VIIPYDALSTEALNSLVSEYCLRDWGLNETTSPLEEREAQVRQALKTKQLLVVYSEDEESAFIKPAADLNMET
tara:strand:- start:9473 stop:9694 length:222 start_codon:yes stop_codon:yes gene_type:complete